MRKIIHVDMDAFFASVEMRDRPELRNVPMAVGGSKDRRGVISTSNYEARKYGVRSAMSSFTALKLCPQLVLVDGHMERYREASAIVFKIFREYTDLVQGLSIDEAFLDVTDTNLFQNSATLIAQDIRKKIFERTGGLTASAGIATNKLIAKLASDYRKPNGQFTVSPKEIPNFIRTVPVERISGVGKVTAKAMNDIGIKTCEDLQKYHSSELIHLFGKFGGALYEYCRGEDSRDVEIDCERKSLATEETFASDIANFDEMKNQVIYLYEDLTRSLSKYDDRLIKNINVKIKYFDFKQTTIERAIPINLESFLNLFEERWLQDPRPIRLIGLGVKFDETKELAQLSLLA